MKRFLLSIAVLVGMIVYVVWAGGKGPAELGDADKKTRPAAGADRVAVLNLTRVLTKHPKLKAVETEVAQVFAASELEWKKLEKERGDLIQALRDPKLFDPARSEVRKQAEALVEKIIAKKEAAKIAAAKLAYKRLNSFSEEIKHTVREYAEKNGINLVLHYSDEKAEAIRALSPQLADRLDLKSCLPLFGSPGVDITADIIARTSGG